jgi:hypothetical protein
LGRETRPLRIRERAQLHDPLQRRVWLRDSLRPLPPAPRTPRRHASSRTGHRTRPIVAFGSVTAARRRHGKGRLRKGRVGASLPRYSGEGGRRRGRRRERHLEDADSVRTPFSGARAVRATTPEPKAVVSSNVCRWLSACEACPPGCRSRNPGTRARWSALPSGQLHRLDALRPGGRARTARRRGRRWA